MCRGGCWQGHSADHSLRRAGAGCNWGCADRGDSPTGGVQIHCGGSQWAHHPRRRQGASGTKHHCAPRHLHQWRCDVLLHQLLEQAAAVGTSGGIAIAWKSMSFMLCAPKISSVYFTPAACNLADTLKDAQCIRAQTPAGSSSKHEASM